MGTGPWSPIDGNVGGVCGVQLPNVMPARSMLESFSDPRSHNFVSGEQDQSQEHKINVVFMYYRTRCV